MLKLKSKPLRAGAKIGVVAPASPVRERLIIEKALTNLQNFFQCKIQLGTTVHHGQDGQDYLAGTDQERQEDLEKMWQDETVEAIWCLRGGYGCLRLLGQLNYGSFGNSPKILMGFSDITSLELAIWSQINLVTFHGPVLTSLGNKFSADFAKRMLTGKGENLLQWPATMHEQSLTIVKGKSQGKLLGGNLTTLVSMIGSPYFPDLSGTILFIEEVKEAAYRIDRLLTQLIHTGALDSIAALIVGKSVPVEGEKEEDIIKVFTERLSGLKIPSAYGFPIGHIEEQWTIPQGIIAEVDTLNRSLLLQEKPFEIA